MDFFAGQDQARRNTGLLVALFCLAVLLLVVLANLLVLVVFGLISTGGPDRGAGAGIQQALVLDWNLFAAISAGILSIVALASLFRMVQLSRGGAAIAEGLGGRLVTTDTKDAAERRLLNVIAEMAIASGTPVPRVYLLEGETGINAFAAGFSSADAVIGITRGAVQQLTRDELQGVIGHEFSHVLNGDMRLNLRLIAVLHGILFLGTIGRVLLRSMRGSRSGSRKVDGTLALLALGLGLIVIGSGGSFCGNLIKAAVSRQREYLADSSAVQFTRNPLGLADALKRIGSTLTEGHVDHSRAAESSHLFFSDAMARKLSSAFSTHPPLAERIRRLDASWKGQFGVLSEGATGKTGSMGLVGDELGGDATRQKTSDEAFVETTESPLAGTVDEAPEQQIEAGPQLGLPDALQQAASNIMSVPALVCSLLLDDESACRQQQLAMLREAAADRDDEAAYYFEQLDALTDQDHLALIDLCSPILVGMSGSEREAIWRQLQMLFAQLDRPGLMRWAVFRQARLILSGRPAPGPRFRRVAQLRSSLELVLSVLARGGGVPDTDCVEALARANTELGLPGLRLLDGETVGRAAVDRALSNLARAFPLLKPRILKACVTIVSADGRITDDERLMMQLIATAIDCPAPALIARQAV